MHKLVVITAGTIAAGVGQSILGQMLEHPRSTLYQDEPTYHRALQRLLRDLHA